MKAAVYYANGGPEVLRYEDVPAPDCGAEDVVIQVASVSVEGGDLINREIRPLAHIPHIVGYQCAGTIVAVGEEVRDRRIGQKVVAILDWGSHAELAAAPAGDTWVLPDGMDIDQAAAVPVAWGTAHECLFAFGSLQAGETVLIHAGAGALGLAAIQLAKRAGARVFATASGAARLDLLRPFGMDLGIDYRSDDFVEVARRHTDGRGVDLVIDSIAGRNLARSIEALAWRGRAITVGVSGRDAEGLDPVSLWRRGNSLHGVYFPTLLDREHARVHAMVQQLLDQVARGELRVVVDRVFPLSEAADAHRHVLSRQAFGRVLLRP
ncbi:quinone oxidoreductase family protein [Plastoroseomonas hellenica]|uniref:quinone oxidoreductase family protein n=1 Tax=Plastoroseomonas hellenica TaxID=2687306 RepID=UPI001BADB557|nr:zinc-binding alcohol dehydrogenase family protein [Plastoroseomonas hellenica]MBR0641751.1 zinc-binding alcohol dehydrogenase family protein [Plastoroseomonas hellenica]